MFILFRRLALCSEHYSLNNAFYRSKNPQFLSKKIFDIKSLKILSKIINYGSLLF